MLEVFGQTGVADGAQPLPTDPKHVEEKRGLTLLRAAQFLHKELPIRFAHRIVELESLPFGLSETQSVQQVAAWYRSSFKELRECEAPVSIEDETKVKELIQSIYERHNSTLVTMAAGIQQFRREQGYADPRSDGMPQHMEKRVHKFLDAFFSARIGIRTLIEQHLALHDVMEGYVGIINTKLSPVQVCRMAAEDAQYMAEREFGDVPEVQIIGDEEFRFSYIPSHLRLIVFELVKNSLRAVWERHGEDFSTMPPVRIIVAAGPENEDIVIKVADEGGGIHRKGVSRMFSYFYTTWAQDEKEGSVLDRVMEGGDFSTSTPMAGLGYGLPLSRLYARYFGGDLNIVSMEGYGTDAFIHLPRVGDEDESLFDCGVHQDDWVD